MSNNRSDYYKERYEEDWDASAKKESAFRSLFESHTGLKLINHGLGAESTDFISGSASENGSEKGASDFRVKDTNVYIEVTGPLKNSVKQSDPLWFRPDKIDYANSHYGRADVFLAHYCPSASLWRIVHVDGTFLSRYKNKEFKFVEPYIRKAGVSSKEHYVEIPATDACVKPLDALFNYINPPKPIGPSSDNAARGRIRYASLPANAKLSQRTSSLQLNPAFNIIDYYLTNILSFKRRPCEYYVGYKTSAISGMAVTITPKESTFVIKIANQGRDILDEHSLCEPDGKSEKLVINTIEANKVGDVLNLLRQLI